MCIVGPNTSIARYARREVSERKVELMDRIREEAVTLATKGGPIETSLSIDRRGA